jgi:hypothetical protein
MTEPERRFTSGATGAVEMRAAQGSGGARIGGYAAVFGKLSRDLGGFREQVATTAFDKSKSDGWPYVVARFDHSNAALLGTVSGGTLTLSVDRVGLAYECEPPSARADIVELVGRGDIQKSSFAFYTVGGADEWDLDGDGYPLRTLVSVRLVDVSPVITPAYNDSSAGLRSLAEHMGADPKEVRALAAQNRLRTLFVRSDAPRMTGPAALSVLTRRSDPWVGAPGQSR